MGLECMQILCAQPDCQCCKHYQLAPTAVLWLPESDMSGWPSIPAGKPAGSSHVASMSTVLSASACLSLSICNADEQGTITVLLFSSTLVAAHALGKAIWELISKCTFNILNQMKHFFFAL